MSNLLPESFQKKMLRDFQARFVVVGSLLAMSTALVAFLALLPVYIILYTTQPAPLENITAKNESDMDRIATAQLLTQQYGPMVSATTTGSAIIAALAQKPSSVRIDHISYAASPAPLLVITGIAANREAINTYHARIVKEKYFTSASIPVGDLIGSQGGRFKLTLSGDF